MRRRRRRRTTVIKSNNPHLAGGEKRLHRSKNDETGFGWTRTIQVQMKKQSKDVSSNIRAACTTPNTEIISCRPVPLHAQCFSSGLYHLTPWHLVQDRPNVGGPIAWRWVEKKNEMTRETQGVLPAK